MKPSHAGNENYVPDYLCYFHHSFQLDPSYKFYYFNDGQISDDMRKKYLYKKKNFAKYEAKFKNLVTIDETAGSQKEEDIMVSGDDDDDVVVNLNLDQTANATDPNAGQQTGQDNPETKATTEN